MCRSMVDIQSETAKIRRGKKQKETAGQKSDLTIYCIDCCYMLHSKCPIKHQMLHEN